MPLKRFELLREDFHDVDNSRYKLSNEDELFRIRLVVKAIRNECVKTPTNNTIRH